MPELLCAEHVSVNYPDSREPAVRDISFSLSRGRVLGIVGESGCGKTTLIRALMGLLPADASMEGEVFFCGERLSTRTAAQRRAQLGCEMGMIVQNSISSLNPIRRVRSQFAELYREKLNLDRRAALAEAAALLEKLHCPQSVLERFPFQLSGGQRQRVIIAMALALKPALLIADEPTTALDVTVQAEILRELRLLKNDRDAGIVLISHNLGVVAQIADKIAVMLDGQMVEYGSRQDVLEHAAHPYTQELIACIPVVSRVPRKRLYSIAQNQTKKMRRDGGCPFADRCARSMERCFSDMPACHPKQDGNGYTRCHLLNSEM